jgi:hypothetical protein
VGEDGGLANVVVTLTPVRAEDRVVTYKLTP